MKRSAPLLLVVLLPLAAGFNCGALALPALLASDPAPGGTIARSAWMVLEFADVLPFEFQKQMVLTCGTELVAASAHALDATRAVVQPDAALPAAASCKFTLNTKQGTEILPFQTAAAGPAFEATYERRNTDHALPFPDDFFLVNDPSTVTGYGLAVHAPVRPGSASGFVQGLADVAATQADGWSPIGNLGVNLGLAADPAFLPLGADSSVDPLSTIALFDMTPGSDTYGERIPFDLVPRSDTFAGFPISHNLLVFPSVPLEPTGTYGFVVTDRVLSTAGEPLSRSPFFALATAPPVAGEAAEIAQVRALADEVMGVAETLSPVPIPRDDVVLAVRLTVRDTAWFKNDMLALREDVLETPPNVVIDSVESDSDPDVAALIHGTFEAPNWLVNGFLGREDGAPVQDGTLTLPFVLALPADAAVDGHAPIIMYQHGNPGSAEAEVPSAARSFMGKAGFAVGGFTDTQNRLFPDVNAQQLAIFAIVMFVGEPPDWYLETYGDQIAFVYALRSLDTLDVLPLGAPDGVPDLDPSAIVYEGISYGSVHAQAFLPYAPEILAGGLVVGASRLAELIEYQDRTTPLGGARLLTETLPSFLTGADAPDLWMGLSLFALNYDRQDPHNHARFWFRDPVEIEGYTRKPSVLVVEGINDHFTKANTTRSLAWQLGPLPQITPADVPVVGLPQQAGPIQANIDAQTTGAFVQYVPFAAGIPKTPGCGFQTEGHYCAQSAPESRARRIEFYTSALSGPPIIE